jgi:hypothetical protein
MGDFRQIPSQLQGNHRSNGLPPGPAGPENDRFTGFAIVFFRILLYPYSGIGKNPKSSALRESSAARPIRALESPRPETPMGAGPG